MSSLLKALLLTLRDLSVIVAVLVCVVLVVYLVCDRYRILDALEFIGLAAIVFACFVGIFAFGCLRVVFDVYAWARGSK